MADISTKQLQIYVNHLVAALDGVSACFDMGSDAF